MGNGEMPTECLTPVPGWWAIYTRHQHEKLAADSLAYRGFEVFLPLYSSLRRWSDRVKELSLPLFPGYLFVRRGLGPQSPILTTPGVAGLVEFAGEPALVSDAEIESVRQVLTKGAHIEPHPFLKCGDWVRVNGGPLQGLEGILVRNKNQFRLVLSVDLVQKSVAVEVDAWMVDPAPRARRESGRSVAIDSSLPLHR
jgi:transcription antitermination factor NusG